jgi:acyl-CoA reductase-like NAD-dependent aldehyde dehydrogenase
MTTIFKNYIGGQWVAASAGKLSEDRNPADTTEVLGLFQSSGQEDVEQAIEAASAAFPSWAAMPAPKRGQILFRAAQIIESRSEEMARTLTQEEGKTLAESRGEVLRAVELFRYYAGEGRRLNGETFPSEAPKTFLYTFRVPLGVVAIVTPWNFPIAIPAWKMAPALIAGNTVVFKPASLTPLIALRLVECLAEAGLPAGVLNLVTGSGGAVGDALVSHPKVAAVSFTGSCEVGTAVRRLAASHTNRIQLEMGGKNPLVVLDDADLEMAADIAAVGGFGLTGQACTAGSRVIVTEKVADQFTALLVERAKSIRVGNGLEAGVRMGPAVSDGQLNTDLGYIHIGKEEGAELLYGGRRLEGGPYDRGYFIEPAVFANVRPSMRIAQEEIFGPVISVLRAGDFDEAVEIANGVKFGLVAGICTRSLNKAFAFAEVAQAGVIKVNKPTTGLELQVPFGGIKDSSSGTYKEQGKAAIDFYTTTKTVYVDYR